jgi:hypothetical protein
MTNLTYLDDFENFESMLAARENKEPTNINLTYLDDFESFDSMLAARANNGVVDDVWTRHQASMKSDIQVAYSTAFDKGLKNGMSLKECTKLARAAANEI